MGDTNSIDMLCAELIEQTTRLLSDLQRIAPSSNHAQRDLGTLPTELEALRLSVRATRSLFKSILDVPGSFGANLRSVLTGCNHVVRSLVELLSTSTSSQLHRGVSWTTQSRQIMKELLISLQAHNSAVDIALEMLSMMGSEAGSIGQSQQQTPIEDSQQQSTADQIFLMLREIRVLQFQVARLTQAQVSSSTSLQRFLEDISEYAESVYQESDGDSIRLQAIQQCDNESEIEDFYSVRSSFTDSGRPSVQATQQSTEYELLAIEPSRITSYRARHATQYTYDLSGPPTVLPSSSSRSEHSAWSYASVRLRLSNRLYSFKSADVTTRNIMSSISFLETAVRAVRLARQQGVVPVSDEQKTWIDQQVVFAEQSMERAETLLEPAMVDLQKRAKVRFTTRISFVLRDTPRIQACFEQLKVAGSGLTAAANLLYGSSDEGLRGSDRGREADRISLISIPAPPYSLESH